MQLAPLFLILVFVLGYLAIIFEATLRFNKTAVALLLAAVLWGIQISTGADGHLSVHLAGVAQVILFLIGAMTIVELVDSHKGFTFITDLIDTTSKRKMLWLVGFSTFFLSSVLDNLTTTILMISLLRKLIAHKDDRFLLLCAVVIAANSGGAWTPIGDVTTTMLWIEGQLSSLAVMKALFFPSLVSLCIPMLIFTARFKGRLASKRKSNQEAPEPGARLVLVCGLLALLLVPVLKAVFGLPPFLGVLLGLSGLWLVTDVLHHKHLVRERLRVPYILTRIDISGVLFFLGILLSVAALDSAGLLKQLAIWLGNNIGSLPLIATLIGLISAVIDNVPLVAATMGMYSIKDFPMDSSLWHMIAYAAGTGGSILIIGSAAGVALMGIEKVDFFSYLKKAAFPALLGFLGGMLLIFLLQI